MPMKKPLQTVSPVEPVKMTETYGSTEVTDRQKGE